MAAPSAEVLWQCFFERSAHGVVVLDRNGYILAANTAMEQILRARRGELLGREMAAALQDATGSLGDLIAEVLKSGQPGQAEASWKGQEGEERTSRVAVIPVANDAGDVAGLVALVQDVTVEAGQRGQLERQVGEIHALQDVLIETLAALAEWRDPGITGHLRRIRTYTRILTEELAARGAEDLGSKEHRQHVARSAVLHDVGKIAVPEGILLKPAPLSPEEYSVVQMHTVVGARILEDADRALSERTGQARTFLRLGAEIARWHHERWDGRGYPDGLRGEMIPLHARVVALVDVYDALTTRRVYKEAWGHEQAVEEIRASRGTHFDPEVVQAFLAVEKEFARVHQART